MLKESVFLAPIAAGIAAGHQLGTVESIQAWCGSPTFAVLGICSAGFLAGGGIVWMTRITASLAFGREAMGLGDVHILAAAGAALGWKAVVIAFFVAPFLALAWLAVFGGLHRLLGTRWREIPYGPYLALACVVSFLGEPWLDPLLRALFVPPA
jgi:leader peptidase (prepilin peptidase)/N-methyltransferase